MAEKRKHSDLQDEAQLEQLLKSGYAAPEPTVKYREALLQQLDQEFVRSYPANVSLLASATKRESHRPRRRISLRVAMTMATAASLLFAIALWNTQSVYGWASMLRALEQCGWVQAISAQLPESRTSEAGASIRGWISSQRGIVALQSADKVAFLNEREHMSSEYLSDRRVIYRHTLPESRDTLGPEAFFELLCQGELSSGFRVLSESWRRVEPNDDGKETVELQVTLVSQGESYNLVVLLDPETHLPRSCRLLTNGQDTQKAFKFVYPTEGPSSIFSLGIPHETTVVASLTKLKVLDNNSDATWGLEADVTQIKGRSAEPETERLATKSKVAEKQHVLAQEQPQKIRAEEVDAPQLAETDRTQQAEQRLASNPPRQQRSMPALDLPDKLLAPQVLVEQVNAQLAASWQAQGVSTAERASDTEFLRRVYLDLTGRIPMVSEVYQFLEEEQLTRLEEDSPNRRARLVDELLASRDHATHLATVWRKLLLPEGVNANIYGGTAKLDQWLADRFEQNLPYDRLVRQLLLAEGRVSDSGPILFYAALKLNPEELAGKTARTFLGMRMECAQCHDHPFDATISQEDFWGFAAHFAQISRPRGKMEMTSSVLRVRDNRRGEVMLPESEEVVAPSLPYEVAPLDNLSKSLNEADRSRREVLVDWITTKQNSRFARATVNRVWEHLFGLGLVEPVDDIRVDNPASCPEVLEMLSLDFAASDYDLRRLLRTLVLSDAYQLSSRGATDEPSQSLVFARMNIKSFSADQLYDCISVATQYEAMRDGNSTNGVLARFGNTSRQAFIAQFQAPAGQRTDYHAGIPQALTLMHGRLTHGATDLASSGLLKSLNAPFFTDEQRIETLFLSTLSRFPDETEQEKMLAYVDAASGDQERSRALGDILWALLNSAEFTFIH